MGLFRATQTSLVGIDISSTAVKLLELNRVGKGGKSYRVEAYAVEPLPMNAVEDKAIKDVEAVGDAMRRVTKRAGTKLSHCAVAVAGSAVITKTIQMPADLSDADMSASIEMESEQYIPYPSDEVNLDYEILGPSENNPDEEVDVLLAASKKEIIEDRIAAVEMAGFKAKVVDVELFALENAFTLLAQTDPEIDSEDTIALVDVGATVMTFSVLQNLKIIYTREQSFGGNQLTEQIQHRYGLSYEEASMAKRTGNLPEDYEDELLEPFKEAMGQEVSRAIQYFYNAGISGNIAHTVLAGGCASIPGVVETISHKVGGHVTLANPFASMSVAAGVNKKI
ncbi:pilus assembly protein PilM [Candidatus Venteria ishoeyi]|uniref:Cell division protein FtsA n=1 Tax=Candidatus Venteria ishoeyi TaxID=1899563 RepID=A0A1H6F4Y3_9GAMM|nr:pilus assembly protein PilM [Candidatus Venteria ishoeyi]SEH04441.1 Cell division protein FtsA [Candidatus Venteria ishoeyi]